MADIDYDDLPEDPDEAFLRIEASLRTDIEEAMDSQGFSRLGCFEYMNKVISAARTLEVEIAERLRLPSYTSIDEVDYRNFVAIIDAFTTRVKIIRGRRNRQFSVAFDDKTKKKTRHYLTQIHDIVSRAELDDRKKEALFARVAALQAEVDRKRTRFEAFAAYAIESAGVLGEVGQRIRPLTDEITKLFGLAKSHEDASEMLPKPPPKKQIEHTKKLPPPLNEIDDDIPF